MVVEFDGFTEQETLAKTSPLNNQNIVLTTPEAQADLWEVRTGGLGLLMSVPGDTKPITFIEDLAVPVEKLGVFVRRVEEILSEYGTHGEWYAHASAGCLHLRPLINLKTRRGVSNMRAIADQVVELVIDLEGALSGEHGDGLARTEFNPRLFGPHLIGAFRDVKRTFDPNNLFNPGKIVWPRGSSAPRMDENLRYGPGYQIEKPQTFFSFHKEGGLARAAESCVGVGICRKDDGLMCPSYQATKEEHNLTRGRANALRMALSGQLPTGALTSQELYEIFDLCLECKGCKAECPTGVDVARLKSEFLALYQAEHGIPLRSRLFAEINILSRWASPIAGLLNNLGSLSLLKSFLERFLGVSSQRQLPALTSHSFRRWFNQRNARVGGEPVLLFVDTYIDHMCPEVGRAAVEVLEAAGFQVMIEPNQGCCGRPMISKGLLARAKSCAENNLKVLAPYAQEGIPIVGVEPSCILTLRDEYLDFFPQDLRARQVARHAYLIEELLTEPNCDGLRPIQRISLQRHEEPWMLHGHCYVKALVGTNPTMDMLRAAEGEVREIPSGCCGMAGSFGYETEHYELSMQIGDMILFPAVRKGLREGAKIIAHGMSCRTQIQDGTGVKAIHPVQALAECLVKETDHPPP